MDLRRNNNRCKAAALRETVCWDTRYKVTYGDSTQRIVI